MLGWVVFFRVERRDIEDADVAAGFAADDEPHLLSTERQPDPDRVLPARVVWQEVLDLTDGGGGLVVAVEVAHAGFRLGLAVHAGGQAEARRGEHLVRGHFSNGARGAAVVLREEIAVGLRELRAQIAFQLGELRLRPGRSGLDDLDGLVRLHFFGPGLQPFLRFTASPPVCLIAEWMSDGTRMRVTMPFSSMSSLWCQVYSLPSLSTP